MLVTEDPFFGLPVAAAGGGAMAAGLVCLLGLGEGRALVIPPVVVGAIFLATGLVMQAAEFDPAIVLTIALVLVVMAGSVFPWLALGRHRHLGRPALHAPPTSPPSRATIDPARVGADARVAHEILVAVTGDRRPAAGPGRAARGLARRHRRRARGALLPGRHAAHPAVPHRHRGPRRPGLRHPRPRLDRRSRRSGCTPTGGPRSPWCSPPPVPRCSRDACCRRPRRYAAAGSATSPRASRCSRCCRCSSSRSALFSAIRG